MRPQSCKRYDTTRLVKVGFKINSVSGVDDALCVYDCNWKIFLTWNEPELAGFKGSDRDIDWASLFDPQIEIANARQVDLNLVERRILNRKEGDVKWSLYYTGSLFCNFKLRHFPFDYQDLRIHIRPHKMPLQKVEFTFNKDLYALDDFYLASWDLCGLRTESFATNPMNSSTRKSYSEFHICIMVRRTWLFYASNMMLFTFFITIMSWGSFAMFPQDVGSRCELTLACVLSSVALKFVASKKLPKIAYMTLADYFFLVNFVFVCSTVLSAVAVFLGAKVCFRRANTTLESGERCTYRPRDDGCECFGDLAHVDTIVFWCHVAAFVAFHVWFCGRVVHVTHACRQWRRQALEGTTTQRAPDKVIESNGGVNQQTLDWLTRVPGAQLGDSNEFDQETLGIL